MFTSTGFVRRNICGILLLSFGAATLAAAPQLRLSNTAVGTIYVENGANAAAQTVNAFNVGNGALNLSVISSASWLSGTMGQPATCSGGPVTACIPIKISLNTSGLAVGTYTEWLTLTDPNAIDSPQNITVTVQVGGAPASADLYVTPNNGGATAQSGTSQMTVNTGGSVQSSIKTSDNGQWLSFALFGGGSYTFFTPYQLRVTSQPGQAEGNYSGTVVLSGSPVPADNQSVAVTMHVTSQPIVQYSPITLNLVQGQALQTYNVGFQNAGLGTLSITGVSTAGGSWLSASAVSPTTVGVTVDTSSLGPGSYSGSLTLASNAANTAVPIPVRVNVAAASNPLIAVGGVVDNAAFASGQAVGSGTIAAVFGTQFSAMGAGYASSLPLPTVLNGIQVLMNGTPVPLFYIDANQADIQVPFGITGPVVVQVVRNGNAGNQVSAIVDSIAPRLFPLTGLPSSPDTSPYGIVINASDNTLALPSNIGVPAHPAHRGDVVTIYALGLGPVTPSVSTGAAAPAVEPLARVANPVQVLFGGGFLGSSASTPSYAGLAPNFAGLYQINVAIPLDCPLGNIPVMISMPGHASNFVEMAIAATPAM